MFERLCEALGRLPLPAYIFPRFVLAESCALLLLSFALFAECFDCGFDYGLYMTAFQLLETPAGLILLGAVGTVLLSERS